MNWTLDLYALSIASMNYGEHFVCSYVQYSYFTTQICVKNYKQLEPKK